MIRTTLDNGFGETVEVLGYPPRPLTGDALIAAARARYVAGTLDIDQFEHVVDAALAGRCVKFVAGTPAYEIAGQLVRLAKKDPPLRQEHR